MGSLAVSQGDPVGHLMLAGSGVGNKHRHVVNSGEELRRWKEMMVRCCAAVRRKEKPGGEALGGRKGQDESMGKINTKGDAES